MAAPYQPAGDQPVAIATLTAALGRGEENITLLGITGSGKSATIAWTIEATQRPALVIAPNKSLAAQLAVELGELLPDNRVVYFVSYYDHYRPEAYVPSSDTYLEKEATINAEIDRMRHDATSSLLGRRDVVVVASVSCIYGLGSPDTYERLLVRFAVGETVDLTEKIAALVANGYTRNDVAPHSGQFRVAGDTLDIAPPYRETLTRITIDWDEIASVAEIEPLSGQIIEQAATATIWPARHFSAEASQIDAAVESIGAELTGRLAELTKAGKTLEAARLETRTRMDLEMLANTGSCAGIENYSRHLEQRDAGDAPSTLLDYFAEDYLCFLDESHVTVPQLRGQHAGDANRKQTLVDHGFRLPSAKDNRPLTLDEFKAKAPQRIYVSATPGPDERAWSTTSAELVIRPTGLLDPPVRIVGKQGQLVDLLARIERKRDEGWRTLITTTTKKMAEDLVDWLEGNRVKARYLHSDIDTVERIEILRDLRLGSFDVLVGVNLLREGLDLPEVALVAVMDADIEGLFRSTTSLIQTFGRAARNANGEVVCYADRVTEAMRNAIQETERRRSRQAQYNAENNITPTTVTSGIKDLLLVGPAAGPVTKTPSFTDREQLAAAAEAALDAMLDAAGRREFEEAARWRDQLEALERQLETSAGTKRKSSR